MGTAPSAHKFTFSLDHNFATGAIQIDPASNPALLTALADPNASLPSGDTVVAGGDLQVSPGQNVTLGAAKVGFSADVNAAIGIYSTPAICRTALFNNAGLVSQVADQITMPAADRLLLLRWGYDISGTASGTVACAPAANVSFSGSAETKGYFAVVQGVAANAKAWDSLKTLIESWKLPSQVNDIAKMPQSTILISEVDGSFSAGVKVSFGYNFNWVRAVDGLGLKGDVGLKLQAALSASLGFGMSGKYAVMLSRETAAPMIRMRLYKLRVNNWNLGFDASVTATPQAPAPGSLDDLVQAMVGTHHRQILKLLGDVKDWSNPNSPIFGPFVNLADSEAQKLIRSLTGITDLAGEFNALKSRFQKLFTEWDSLPQTATQLLWAKLPDQQAITAVAAIAQQVSQMTGSNLETFIQSKLSDVSFMDTDKGKALESFSATELFSALQDTAALADIQKAATAVTSILDGGVVQELLTKLQSAINTKLDLKQLESVVNQTSFDSLDTWLKARLESFLEQKLVGSAGLAELIKLRTGLHAILTKADDLYNKALAALKKNYGFSITATYQQATTTSALLDADFDFGATGSQAAEGLRLALSGKFDQLLESSLTGVKVNEGVLAYEINRQTHVTLALPYFSSSSLGVNDAVAQLQTTDDGGLMFSLSGTDTFTVKNDYSSALTIALSAPSAQNQVNVHSSTAAYRYDLKVGMTNLTSAALSEQFGPYANEYFADELKPPAGSFADWAKLIAPANGKFANALVSLSVSLPSSAAAAWMNAPDSQGDGAYKKMSMALQEQFKQALHDTFFNDVRNYKNVSGDTAARAVLAFCSIPACSDVELTNGGDGLKFLDASAGGNTIYWDYRDRGENPFGIDLREKVLSATETQANLLQKLRIAQERLKGTGDPDHVLSFYADNAVGPILGAALHGQLLDFLFPVEAHMVEQARAAGIKLAAFRKNNYSNPDNARKDLAAFGQKLSADFNANLKIFAVNNALLPLGTAIYAAGASALDPTAHTAAAAMFTLEMLKPAASTLTPQDSDVLCTERIVHGAAFS